MYFHIIMIVSSETVNPMGPPYGGSSIWVELND